MGKVDKITDVKQKHEFWKPSEDLHVHSKEESYLSSSSDSLHKYKKVKKKRTKHEKKKKKHKKRRKHDKDNSSSDEEEEWVESTSSLPSSEMNKREDWMHSSFDFIPTVSKREIEEQKKSMKKTEVAKNALITLDKPGQHHRELNPYWKNGGTGLPPEIEKETPASCHFSSLAEKGVDQLNENQWAKQQVENVNRSLEKAELGSSQDTSMGYRFYQKQKNDSSSRQSLLPKFQKPSGKNFHQSCRNQIQKAESKPSWMKKDHFKHGPQSTNNAESISKSDKKQSTETVNELPAAPVPQCEKNLLSDKEMNVLGAKLVKAELLGNFQMAATLKAKLDAARNAKEAADQKNKIQKETSEETVILTQTDNKGLCRPLPEPDSELSTSKKHRQKARTHDAGGKRVFYFPDDSKYSLKQMFEREKFTSAEDQNSMFLGLAGKSSERTTDDYDIDDIFLDKAAKQGSNYKSDEYERNRAIYEYKQLKSAMDKCPHCFDSPHLKKHLIIAVGLKVFLCLPGHQSLTQGHCLIIPMRHLSASTLLDEDEWEEVQVFRKNLTKMFNDKGNDVIFMEMSKNLKWHPHTFIECIPLQKEIGDMAPIYFKKAILESDVEWAVNKKLIDLSVKKIQHSVPKGLPYFSVQFGLQGGFAHVIEDEKLFPSYFGKEVIGGMLDLETNLWRKPRYETFEDQSKKALEFAEWWKPFDFKM